MIDPVVYTAEQVEILAKTDAEMDRFIEGWKRAAHQDDASLLEAAYKLSKEAHRGQFRATGEPYIIHPVAAMKILFDLGLVDDHTLAASLVHDTVEDTDVTLDEIEEALGEDVAELVDGVTKLSRISY